MFKSLKDGMPADADFSQRTLDLLALERVLDGTLYEHLPYDFHQEKNAAGEYIPLRQRRPSVRTGICRTVVDDAVSLLFSEGHFPALNCAVESVRKTLEQVVRDTRLNEVMMEAATLGAVGSIAIRFRVLEGRVFFDAMRTAYLTPCWKASAPDTLAKVTEQYKVRGAVLRELGYAVADELLNQEHWFRREWDEQAEIWYLPWAVGEEQPALLRDNERSVEHGLGFVPLVWVRNLPGGNGIDGAATCGLGAINSAIEIDYLLSQAGRGLKYSSDPTLLIKEPAVDASGQLVKGAGNAITVGKDGDAKLLEINGSSALAVIDFVRALREMTLEQLHGNRANADRVVAAQSGRAMELLNQALIWLADKMRVSYGEGALLDLLTMVMRASGKLRMRDKRGNAIPDLGCNTVLSLRWPAWYTPTAADRAQLAQALVAHTDSGHMSRSTATRIIAPDYGIEDVVGEAGLIIDGACAVRPDSGAPPDDVGA